MKPLISVIVPVYNIENYLSACVHSLLAQTYRNLEILLIDDGSTDGSGKLCDEFQQRDDRITVIHKQNAGVADSRNTGLDAMHGDYYCFVDGDDTVHPDYIETMYSLLIEYKADIAMCMYHFTWTDGKQLRTRNAEYPDDHIFVSSGKDALTNMLYTRIYAPACWGKLYPNTGSTARFSHYAIGEDMLFVTEQLLKTGKIVMSNKTLYNYMQHEASVMHSVNPDKIYDVVRSGDAMLSIIPADEKKLQKAASYYIVEKNLSALMKLYELPGQKDRLAHIAHNIKRHRMAVLQDKTVRSVIRLNCLFSFFGIPALYRIKKAHNVNKGEST